MVSGRFVSLKVSTVEAIMDCLNSDIVMVLSNELLTDLEVSGEWDILCFSHHKCIIMFVSHTWGVQNMVYVSHTPQLLIFSAVYW